MSESAVDQVLQLKQAAEGRIEDNENATQKGVNNVYEPPPGRVQGSLDSRWGDKPPPVVTHGTAAMQAARDTREDMLERLFDSIGTSAPAEQALMSKHFENAAQGHPHSPILSRGRAPAKTAQEETLSETLFRVLG